MTYDFHCHNLPALQIASQLYLPVGAKIYGDVVVLIAFEDLKASFDYHIFIILVSQ
jgi:hypothetical protein